MAYLVNTWYMAAWADEVQPAAILSRRLLDQSVALYRREDGGWAALADRCPHRFAKLSLGRVQNDRLICRYHGLQFNHAGQCVRAPLSEKPPSARVRAYPVVERDSIVWIWMGDPERARPELIPEFEFVVDPHRTQWHGYSHVNASYELSLDNLMDLSHVEFVHSESIGISPERLKKGSFSVERDKDIVTAKWRMPDFESSPGVPIDAGFESVGDITWRAPACMVLEVGRQPIGASKDLTRLDLGAHLLTPETESSTHYFWGASNTESAGRPAQSYEQVLQNLVKAFEFEDKPTLEGVQENLRGREFWAEKPLLLATDAAAVHVRRTLAKLIELERA
jgi:vanillate O-demethylase monooxygenase subunit